MTPGSSVIKPTTKNQANTSTTTMSPFPLLDALRRDAQQIAPVLYDGSPLRRIVFIFADGEKFPVHCSARVIAPRIEASSDMPALTTLQRNILISLRDEGPASGEVLAQRLGYSAPSSLYARSRRPGGIRALMEQGIVLNDEENGYELTEFGQDVADRLGGE
jgi:biotin operon repressor